MEAIISAPVQTGPGAHSATYTMRTGSFPGVKRPGRGADHPPPSNAEVKERVELYLYSPSGPLWPVSAQSLPFICTYDRNVHICTATAARSPFKDETRLFYIRIQCVPRSKHCPPRLHKTSLLMLHKAKVAVCSEIHT